MHAVHTCKKYGNKAKKCMSKILSWALLGLFFAVLAWRVDFFYEST